MAINATTVGPGTLTFSNPSATVASQITAARVNTSARRGDTLKVLSGEEIASESDYGFTLEFSCLQDMVANGLVDFSWKNRGKTASFTYTPNTAAKGTIAGSVVVDPISVGGPVGERATSDVTWNIVGVPRFTPST